LGTCEYQKTVQRQSNIARKYKTEHINTRDVSTHNKIYTNKNEQRKKEVQIKATQANIGPHSSTRLTEAKDAPEFSCTFFNIISLSLIQRWCFFSKEFKQNDGVLFPLYAMQIIISSVEVLLIYLVNGVGIL
jgi:hypothetical protein